MSKTKRKFVSSPCAECKKSTTHRIYIFIRQHGSNPSYPVCNECSKMEKWVRRQEDAPVA